MHHHRSSIKNLLLAFCVTLAAFNANAQWVSIPDTNFGKWLNTNGYNMCLQGNSSVGWQMDTTCNEVVSETVINCNAAYIRSIEGIQYFDTLLLLICTSNELTSLPELPSTLNILYCYQNKLASLPSLPNSLYSLRCHQNKLVSLPPLPNTLIELWCHENLLASLPSLPNVLRELDCNSNQLSVLPILPNSLIKLFCINNQLTTLPALPGSLTTLICYSNQLTSLPTLPNSLTSLQCYLNQLTSLPVLSNSLTYLDCNRNQLASLPTLPNSLINLNCGSNQLTSMPALPNSLYQLYCGGNKVDSLPALPNSLSILHCQNNNLSSLPTLPSVLGDLNCDNNQLTSLPALTPLIGKLSCGYNKLTTLPPLPNHLTELNCRDNLLNSLPALPDKLDYLNCQNNPPLSCLPKLGIVRSFVFGGTSVTCFPNYPQQNYSSNPPLNSIPLCDVLNANGCEVYYNISGKVFSDTIQNCVKDVAEVEGNTKVLLFRNGVLEQQSVTMTFGSYSFDTNLDTFETRVDTAGLPYTVACPSTFFHTSILTPQDSIDTDKDFGLRCKLGFDVGVLSAVRDSGMLFPAQQAGIHVKAGDLSSFYGLNCAAGISGAVSITYSGPVSFAGVTSGALVPTVSGNTLSYSIADFGTIDMQTAFGLRFLVDTFAQIGQQLCLDVVVTPTAGDNNVSNNTATYCFEIVNSYDPNMKEVSPINTIAPDEDWLTYTIHFQNMGNAPAIHIYVMDTLDSNLDESSIQILGSSHRMLTEIKGKFARFNFPNINLIDSATNEPESKGWLQYKIKKKTGLALGTQIKNTASIYFDFNAPVVTNTVTNVVAEPLAVSYIRHPTSDIRLFPNPTNDVVYISYSSKTLPAISLYNLNGAQINLPSFGNLEGLASISLSNLPAGVYFVSVEIGGSVVRKKVVKY